MRRSPFLGSEDGWLTHLIKREVAELVGTLAFTWVTNNWSLDHSLFSCESCSSSLMCEYVLPTYGIMQVLSLHMCRCSNGSRPFRWDKFFLLLNIKTKNIKIERIGSVFPKGMCSSNQAIHGGINHLWTTYVNTVQGRRACVEKDPGFQITQTATVNNLVQFSRMFEERCIILQLETDYML